jgi:signal transduction histidine kinase
MTDLTIQNQSQEQSASLIDRLQQKNKDLRQFAYTFSHDLRAPIARVLGLVSLSDLDPDIIINNKSIMQNVADEIQSLDDVVKDISEGIDMDDASRDKEYIKFRDQILLINNVLEKQIVESEVSIRTNFILLEGVWAVKSYLYSILINLLSNAIKFRRTGVPLVVELISGVEGGMGVLSIKDNGRGIDLVKNKGLVFGLRNRFHSKDVAGTGIGLHLVKSQIESMGGSVTVESEVNKGSTFKVFFPINKNLNVSGE